MMHRDIVNVQKSQALFSFTGLVMCRGWKVTCAQLPFPAATQGHRDAVPITDLLQPVCLHLPLRITWGNALALIRAGHLCSVSPALPRRARCSVSFVLPPSSPGFSLEIWLALGSSQLVFFCAPFEWLPSKFNGPLLLPSSPPVDFSSI